jgi:hypothetical protein
MNVKYVVTIKIFWLGKKSDNELNNTPMTPENLKEGQTKKRVLEG